MDPGARTSCTGTSTGTGTRHERIHRRAFVALFATSAGAPLLAQIQPGTLEIPAATIREAARAAGLTWTDAESEDVADAISSFAKHAEKIDKATLTNASPLPIHYDPRPPGVAVPMSRRAFRPPPAARVQRPQQLEDVAFWPIAQVAELVRSRQATATELTRMYLARLKRHNPALNCVVTLTEERALQEAADADREIARSRAAGIAACCTAFSPASSNTSSAPPRSTASRVPDSTSGFVRARAASSAPVS